VKLKGLPDQGGFVSVPNLFFSFLLENITDIATLKLAFRTIFLIQREAGNVRFVTMNSLLSDSSLVLAIAPSNTKDFERIVRSGIQDILDLGVFLKTFVEVGGRTEELLFLSNNRNGGIISKIQKGEIVLPKLPGASPIAEYIPQPNIFQIYEESIGILTPLIAERLKELEEEFPEAWLYDAIKEATMQNRMRLSYVEGILRRWRQDGRGYETSRGNSGTIPISQIFRRNN
jgi:DnaD/phage-associated family protein